MDIEVVWTLGLTLGLTIPLIIKIAPVITKISSKAENVDLSAQNVMVNAEQSTSPLIGIGGRDVNQFYNCTLGLTISSTSKESAAAAIKEAIRHFFSGVLGNVTKEGKREGGLLDSRNLRSGRLKSDMIRISLDRFQGLRKALHKSRIANAPQLAEADQAILKDLFNNFIGSDERAMNAVSEDDILAITEVTEKEFTEASGKAVNKYLGI